MNKKEINVTEITTVTNTLIKDISIHIAEYWTELPPIDLFQKKIQEIVMQEKRSFENKQLN